MQTKMEEYCRVLKKVKDMAMRELDKFVTVWNASESLSKFPTSFACTALKVRTRSFLTQIDTLKDSCFQEKEACGERFKQLIKSVPFS
jgi:hypothetical protein